MTFEWISMREVPDELVAQFDCGNDTFNMFFKEMASIWMNEGYAVTYVAVSGDEYINKQYTKIFGYASINSMGLLFREGNVKYLSCAEIRMFAVSKCLRGKEAVDIDNVRYSYKLFQSLMQELYYISTSLIGFTAVTLNANNCGIKLYKKFGFIETDKYILPEEEEKIDIQDCTPLIFSLIGEGALEDLFL